MKSLNIPALVGTATGIVGLIAVAAAPAAAQQQQQPPQAPEGWFKACSKQQEVDICNVRTSSWPRRGRW